MPVTYFGGMRRITPETLAARCPDCGVRREQCFCATLPVVATRIRLLFVQHEREARKPTNTARLACRILPAASVRVWCRTEPLQLPERAVILYPAPEAPVLAAEDLTGERTVVVPDGTWGQASRIASELWRRGHPCRALPGGRETLWWVRRSDDPDRISSAQAAAEALRIGGELAAAKALEDALAEASRRILAARGLWSG